MIEVYSVQLPGRGPRLTEAPYTKLFPLVRGIADAIVPWLDKPFAFFGHSMGALICFELARQLRCHGKTLPIQLFISGCSAPQLPDHNSTIHTLPEPAFLRELRRLNGTPEEMLEDAEFIQFITPILRADFEVCEMYDYHSEPALSCPISVFGGIQDFGTVRDGLKAWREQTTSSFSVRMLPGDHFFLHTSRHHLLRSLLWELNQNIKLTL